VRPQETRTAQIITRHRMAEMLPRVWSENTDMVSLRLAALD